MRHDPSMRIEAMTPLGNQLIQLAAGYSAPRLVRHGQQELGRGWPPSGADSNGVPNLTCIFRDLGLVAWRCG
jgi:hypothetical protein